MSSYTPIDRHAYTETGWIFKEFSRRDYLDDAVVQDGYCCIPGVPLKREREREPINSMDFE